MLNMWPYFLLAILLDELCLISFMQVFCLSSRGRLLSQSALMKWLELKHQNLESCKVMKDKNTLWKHCFCSQVWKTKGYNGFKVGIKALTGSDQSLDHVSELRLKALTKALTGLALWTDRIIIIHRLKALIIHDQNLDNTTADLPYLCLILFGFSESDYLILILV